MNRVDRRLVDLIELGFHLPLTLCTNEALEAVRMDPTRLVVKNLHDADRQKVAVVDVANGWPDEFSMCSEDWRDAWTNFLQILPEVLEPEGVERFRRHHDFLVKQPNFKVRFPAILRFDINIRRDYFWGRKCVPFYPGTPEYAAGLAQEQTDWSMEAVTRGATGRQPSAAATLSGNRFNPYSRGGGGFGGGADSGGSQRPFREGRSSASAGPLCLICAEGGHRAGVCTRTKLGNGAQTLALFSRGKLIAASSGKELCMAWNAGGRTPCTHFRCPRGPSAHLCSFCGSADYHAGSKRCL
ncbi:hypothetical protein C8Q77DRAFT_746622 [Trametes polyzona]|nr:hypothetical protein C8Q77DRAFT_746622 [Trametes polyzona]